MTMRECHSTQEAIFRGMLFGFVTGCVIFAIRNSEWGLAIFNMIFATILFRRDYAFVLQAALSRIHWRHR